MHKLSKQAKYYKLNKLFMALYPINKYISITDFGQNSKLLFFFNTFFLKKTKKEI